MRAAQTIRFRCSFAHGHPDARHRAQIPRMAAHSIEDAALQRLAAAADGPAAWVVALEGAAGVPGLARLEAAAHAAAAHGFDALASAPAALAMLGEDALAALLDDDDLTAAGGEEAVFEAVGAWMRSAAAAATAAAREAPRGPRCGAGLMRRVRFPLLRPEYLAAVAEAAAALPELRAMAEEAVALLRLPPPERSAAALRSLGPAALTPRRGSAASGAGIRRAGPRDTRSLAVLAGRVWCGLGDGTVRALDGGAVLRDGGPATGPVHALAAWEGRLWSGATDGRVRAWDVAAGRCCADLPGHPGGVYALAPAGGRLLSGGADGAVRVWAGAGPPDGAGGGGAAGWRCEGAMAGQSGAVVCLAAWGAGAGGMAASGSRDGTVVVWALAAAAAVATLRGHGAPVLALAALPPPAGGAGAGGWRLVSGSKDGTLRVWALPSPPPGAGASGGGAAAGGEGACLATVRAYPDESPQYVRCLAVCGGGGGGRAAVLVAGSGSYPAAATEMYEVRAWALEEEAADLGAEGGLAAASKCGKCVRLVGGNRRLQPAGRPILALAAAEMGAEPPGKSDVGEVVLAAVGDEVVMWSPVVFE